MTYRIETIELYVRETKPGRMTFALGKKGGTGDVKKGLINPLAHVRLVLKNSDGDVAFGCAADRLSVRWLDKRPERSFDRKRRELVSLIESAREIYLKSPKFTSPFEKWKECHPLVMQAGRKAKQENLTSSFASALIERAIVDAVCRIEQQTVFQMVKADRLGIKPASIHPELKPLKLSQAIPGKPMTEFSIRHTVGLADPLTAAELPAEKRVNDGLPETLEEYIKVDGIRHFKVKISGDPKLDRERLEKIWQVVLGADQPVITLDANESYTSLKLFDQFVNSLEKNSPGLFQHIEYVEQPLPRALPITPENERWIRKIAAKKPLLIDEADGTVNAFKQAIAVGYTGASHKNCKGFFKSLLNRALVVHHASQGVSAFLSAEDLQNLPVVPLHQDFAVCGILGLEHCERNGHHYNFGLSMLSAKDKANATKHHPDMYEKKKKEWFLKIRKGIVHCASLQCPGMGVHDEPDWPSMMPMRKWVASRHGK
ncbi:MAG: mandelate racemase [Planctomycetaceae bacterium]